MLAVKQKQTDIELSRLTKAPIVIIGTGSAGIRTAKEILRRQPDAKIVLYGDEPWEPYNRVHLSTFLSGETSWSSLADSCELPDGQYLEKRYNCAVTGIDRDNRFVIDASSGKQPYSKLVIATGSRPHIPAIPGTDLPGVFSFRSMSDVQKLQARIVRSRQTVIIGGGVLGLEAARAMQQHSTEVTLVEHSPRLMNRQLDDEASEILREHVMSLGIRVFLFDGIKEIAGDNGVERIVLNSGRELPCDTVVMVTGIRPNSELALACGLSVGRAIRVNNDMLTSDPDIYAVGECCEHDGQVYGLVAPGLEQAAVAAHSITGHNSYYHGSIAATQLKVIEHNIFSMGEVGEELDPFSHRYYTYKDPQQGIYRKLVVSRHRLTGAIGVGNWPGQGRIQEAISNKRVVWPWQLLRFRSEGELWPVSDTDNVSMWPANAVVCNCTGVTRGSLDEAMSTGCQSAESLCAATGASSVCGSCKPLLARLVGGFIKPERVKGWAVLTAFVSLSVLLLLMTMFSVPVPYSESANHKFHIDILWRDGFWKQVTGFSLLGVSLLGTVISLRKRIKKISFGNYDWWRLFHVVLGGLLLITLVAHTGFRLGVNLNLMLMLTFLGLGMTGVLSASVSAARVRLGMARAQRIKRVADWMHIIVLWPFPLLISLHVLSVYYF